MCESTTITTTITTQQQMSLSEPATEVTQEYATAMEEAITSATKAEPHDPVRWFFQHASPYRKTFCEGCFEEKSNVRWYTEPYNAENMPAWENSTVAKAHSACEPCQTMKNPILHFAFCTSKLIILY